MMCFSTLLGEEFQRRELYHEPSHHNHYGSLQELVPQQEQHILDNCIPITPHRTIWRDIRQRKHEVRSVCAEPGPNSSHANATLARLRCDTEQYWSLHTSYGP